VYGNGVAAVNKNTFCVKKGEVFALLGPNGAGKSSMFNIMTLDLKRSSGEVQVLNTELDNIDVGSQGYMMGMCPQFNTIWSCLSVDQSISFIGEIKGLSAEDIEFQKKFIKETLDLGAYSDTRAANLSGGNKRKLICAMSLVGCPKVEFLDEPTTGVDPVSRRSLFKMLKSLKDSSMILTTHRMDEAESLCDNIAIMINGRFVCYGSTGHLKNTYGQGYSISLSHL
jgi:ATP-binding cassette subfamily A (ABC1) protein 3